ncbi:MAG: lipopolysaccharide kinase InaA family protein [Pirellulales bacterium]
MQLRTIRRWSLTRRLSYDADLPQYLAEALWRGDADRFLYSSTPLQVKDRCTVARHDSANGALLVKRHTWGGPWRTIRSAWREASAHRCARIASYLAEHGIPTPRPRASLEQCVGPFGYRSYFITDYIEGTDLYRYIRYAAPSDADLRHLARQVVGIWQRLVEMGISHNDTKPENFIVDEELGVWLIDFEKVRFGGKPQRQRQRQIDDVKNFLHIRGWHRRMDARQIFIDEFLRTSFGEWLRGTGADDALATDSDLSVLILCDVDANTTSARPVIDSVRDIADEIVLIGPSAGGRLDVIDRIEPCGPTKEASDWMLVLHHDEAVTPFLAKELRQRIAEQQVADAFRLPIDHQFFGRSIANRARADAEPIRLFRPHRCSYSLARGTVTISADPLRTEELSGRIEKCVASSVAEFVEHLNEQTTVAARCRLEDGQRPALVRALIHSFADFLRSYFWHGRARAGWAGFQLCCLEAVFTWLEEAKLYQMSRQFGNERPDRVTLNDGEAPVSEQPSSLVPRAKAA